MRKKYYVIQAGTPQADYIYLNGRPIATLNPATGTLYFLQDDMLGTPQLATDSSQTVAWQAAYGPFGQASVSGSITQNLRFPGQYYDIETGWNHNGFRDYIPELGRYAEPDPLGRLGSGNDLYGYVGDNPGNFVDPLGLHTGCGCDDAHGQKIGPIRGYPETGKFAYRSANDGIIISAVNQFDAAHGFTPGTNMYWTPRELKAQEMVESGGPYTRKAFFTDPLQVNNPGDWANAKGPVTGLRRGEKMNPCLSVTAALKWLLYKASIHNKHGNVTGYRNKFQTLVRYNGNLNYFPNEGGLRHEYWYALEVAHGYR